LLCSFPALQVKTVPLLGALQQLLLFAWALTYLEPKHFPLIIFLIILASYYIINCTQ
jgi:hypothetical protein